MNLLEKLKGNFAKNLGALTFQNFFNYLFPLFTFPYLLRTIGASNYGTFQYVLSFTTYLTLLVDFGFSLTGTKLIAENKDDEENLRVVFLTIFKGKLYLISLALLALTLIKLFTDLLLYDNLFFFLSFLNVIAITFTCDWYFKGIDNLRILSVYQFIVKLILLILLLVFVKSEGDLEKYFYIHGIASFVPSIFVLQFILRKNGISISSLNEVSTRSVLSYFSESFSSFLVLTGTVFSRGGHLFVMRYFMNEVSFGYYTVAFRIIFLAYTFLKALPTTIFSYLGNYLNNEKVFSQQLQKMLLINVAFFSVAALGINLTSEYILNLLSKSLSGVELGILKTMSWFLVFSGVTTILSASFSIYKNKNKPQLLIILVANLIFFSTLSLVDELTTIEKKTVYYSLPLIIFECIWGLGLLAIYFKKK